MRACTFDTLLRLGWHGDAKGAATSMERWPPWFVLEDRAASAAGRGAGTGSGVDAAISVSTVR